MKKKKSKILLLVLVCLILAGIFLVIMISTNEKLEKQEPAIYTSLEDFKNKKLTQVYKNMLNKVDTKVQLEITEKELNDLLAITILDYEKGTNAVAINGYSSHITTNGITIRLDSKLLKLVPVQYVIELLPSVEENRLVLFVSKFKVGKLSINPQTILKLIKASFGDKYNIDLEKQSIVLENIYQDQITLNDMVLEQGKVSINIELSIRSVKDLINVLGSVNVLPEWLKGLVD